MHIKTTLLSSLVAVCCAAAISNLGAQVNPAPDAGTTNTNAPRRFGGGGFGGGFGGGSTNVARPGYGVGRKQPPPIDWSLRIKETFNDLNWFTEANAQLPPPAPGEKRVVFIGDSITENWQGRNGDFVPLGGRETCFPGRTNYVGRGHTAETTQQMLVRFQQDIIDLQPKAFVIMAGVNDVAGNTGEYHLKYTQDCFKSIFDLAEQHHIKPVWVSTFPCNTFFWQRSVTNGADNVYELVQWERQYAKERGIEFVDAYSMLADDNHHMKPGMSSDSVHPTAQGYYAISKVVDESIQKVLATSN